MIPTWLPLAADLVARLGALIVDAVQHRNDVSRADLVAALRALATDLEGLPAVEARDHAAAVDEAVAALTGPDADA